MSFLGAPLRLPRHGRCAGARGRRLLAGVAAVLLAALAPAAPAEAITPAVAVADLDPAQCLAYVDGQAVGPVPLPALHVALGLTGGRAEPWRIDAGAARRRDIRIAFTRALELGTVCTQAYNGPQRQPLGEPYGRFVAVLKPDVEYPGDVTRASDWLVLAPGTVKTLPAGTVTRALRLTTLFRDPVADSPWQPNARLSWLACLRERAFNPLGLGTVTHGGGKPGNTPDFWVMDWPEPWRVGGLLVQMNHEPPGLEVKALKTGVTIAPGLAGEEDWQRVVERRVEPGVQWVPFRVPLETRTLRLSGLSPQSPQDSRLAGVVVPLALLAPGQEPPAPALPPAPVRVPYAMPYAGIAAIQIHDKASGRLVRRLLSETAREAGANVDAWDLKDDSGTFVGPGQYEWRAFVRPPFKLTYQLTANNAGQPGWWAPPPGKGGGGWLGDHGTPNCAAAAGDTVWLGTLCAENGHAAIATDLDGNKLWGTHHIAYGFRGPAYIAAEADAAYLVCPDLVNRVVPGRDFQMRTVFTCQPTPELPWNPVGYDATCGGAAARDGRLYWAINAPPESWLVSAFASDLIDPASCIPGIGLFKGNGRRAERGDKNYGESEYDELMQLYAAFLTGKTPEKTPTLPGTSIPSSAQASFGDAPSEGDLAGSVVVVFREPVTVGSVLVPDSKIQVFALRAGVDPAEFLKPKAATELQSGRDTAKDNKGLTDDLDDMVAEMKGDDAPESSIWRPLKGVPGQRPGQAGVLAAPAGGFQTRALRYQVRRLAFSQVVTHRLANCAGDAKRVFSEGKATPAGGWSLERGDGKRVNEVSPAAVALVWPQPQTVRGLSLTRPRLMGKSGSMAVDVWTGTGDPGAALAADAGWEQVGELQPDPVFQGYFPQEPTCRSIDFGRAVQTTAVRLRIMSSVDGQAGFESVVAWTPLGEDPPGLPVSLSERITVLKMPPLEDDKGEATVERHIPLPKPGSLAFAADGTLYAVSAGRVVRVPLDGQGPPVEVVPAGQVKTPRGLAVDGQGLLYLADGDSRTVRVFDPRTGQLVRTIGKGEQQPGAWDPARLDNPMQIAVDRLGRLWVSDASYQPKRVQRFAADGAPDKAFLGPTQYGGGGWMDEGNRNLIYYNGMRFVLDWPAYGWRLDSLVYRPQDPRFLAGVEMPDKVVYHNGKRYLVGPAWGHSRDALAVVCQEQGDLAVPRAALGQLSDWGDIARRPDLRARFGALDNSTTVVCWGDANGDGQPQLDEVQTAPAPAGTRGGWTVGEDLTFYAVGNTGYRLRPVSFRPDGSPVYDLAKLESFTTFTHGPGARTQTIWGTGDGRIFMIGTRLIAADGQTMLWEYYNQWACHEGFYQSGFGFERPAGVLNQEHKPIGHVRLGEEEYFFTNTDQGDIYCFTADGFFAGCVFGGPAGYGLRTWTMPEWTPGQVDLSDVRLPMEHYQGCIVKAEDDKIYAVVGHNHMSVVLVEGLEGARRLRGDLAVSAEDLERTREWDVQRQALAAVRRERKAARVLYQKKDLAPTGDLSAWPKDIFVTIHETFTGSAHAGVKQVIHAQAALAYNERNLFVAAKVLDGSPLRNAAADPKRLFQHGDALDLTLGLDAKADPKRRIAVAGDLRLLFAVVKDKPVAVLYKPVAPDAPAAERARFESPVGSTSIEQVKVLETAQVGIRTDREGESPVWTLTASVPWSELGVQPPAGGEVLRGDLGVLVSDPNGVETLTRWYWSGKSQTVVCDVPSETRLIPALWGELHFATHDLLDDAGGKSLIEEQPGLTPDDLLK